MATLQYSTTMLCNKPACSSRRSTTTRSMISLPKLPSKTYPNHHHHDNLIMTTKNTTYYLPNIQINHDHHDADDRDDQSVIIAEMHAIMDAAADRAEMHRNVGEQRDNWNSLLLSSLNSMTLAAATMSGLAAAVGPAAALSLGAAALYVAATGISAAMSKLQPSQLAEEQRNAARLFDQLRREIRTKLSLRHVIVTAADVSEAMERVLALDKAYPLPLLGGAMLEKFPEKAEPARWWPRKHQRKSPSPNPNPNPNGWSKKLEEEMREVCGVIKRRDLEEYERLSEKALRLNKFLAVSGPALTGLAAVGAALGGHGTAAAVVLGALATVVNAVEHGGQVGMVFEMYRSNAGFFKLAEETIRSGLDERRENGDVFETKVALQLGRSVSELRTLARKSRSRNDSDNNAAGTEEFASKLF